MRIFSERESTWSWEGEWWRDREELRWGKFDQNHYAYELNDKISVDIVLHFQVLVYFSEDRIWKYLFQRQPFPEAYIFSHLKEANFISFKINKQINKNINTERERKSKKIRENS